MALLMSMMALLLLTALGLALVLTTSTETMIANNYGNAAEGLYVADAGIERAMEDILTVPDWNTILAGTTQSAFIDGPPTGDRTLPSGGTLNLDQVVNMADCGKISACTDGDINAVTVERPWGQNNPRWRLYAYGPMNNIIPTATVNSPYYLVVMVADDPPDGTDLTTPDHDPLHDLNGAIEMRAEAFGPGNSHKVIEVTLSKTDASELERGYIGQRGQDEQNRRARKAAVQTPGKSLSVAGFAISTGGKMVQ